MRREVHRRLTRGVPGADDVDVEAVRVRCLASGGAVEDALSRKTVEAGNLQLPPGDTARDDDRAGPEHVPSVEVHMACCSVDPVDRAGDEDLGAQSPRLVERLAREVVAGDAGREAEVVLDAGRGAGLAAGRLALDGDDPKSLRGAVDRRGEPGRAGPDDDDVVLGVLRLGREVEEFGDPPGLRPDHGLAVDDPQRGVVALGGKGAPPLLRILGNVRPEPSVDDLVAFEEPAQLGAGGVPAVADDDRARPRRLRRKTLEAAGAAHPIRGEAPHLERDIRRNSCDRVVVPRLDPHHARLLRRAEPDGKHGAQGDRELAEDVAGVSLPDDRLDPVFDLDGLDAALEQREERALVARIRGVLASWEGDVGRRARQALLVRGIEAGKDRDPRDLVGGHHARRSQGRIGDTLLVSRGARATMTAAGRAPC